MLKSLRGRIIAILVIVATALGYLYSNGLKLGLDLRLATGKTKQPEEDQAAQQAVHVAIVYQKDGSITGYRNGLQYGQSIRKPRSFWRLPDSLSRQLWLPISKRRQSVS